MRNFFRHVSLQSLLLLFALAGVSLAWWIDRSRPPEVYHLQLWASEFDTDLAKRDPSHPEYGKPMHLATFSIESGTPFNFDVPNDYNPTIRMSGTLKVRGKQCFGKPYIWLEAPDVAMVNDSAIDVPLDQEYHMRHDDRFFLIVSRNSTVATP